MARFVPELWEMVCFLGRVGHQQRSDDQDTWTAHRNQDLFSEVVRGAGTVARRTRAKLVGIPVRDTPRQVINVGVLKAGAQTKRKTHPDDLRIGAAMTPSLILQGHEEDVRGDVGVRRLGFGADVGSELISWVFPSPSETDSACTSAVCGAAPAGSILDFIFLGLNSNQRDIMMVELWA